MWTSPWQTVSMSHSCAHRCSLQTTHTSNSLPSSALLHCPLLRSKLHSRPDRCTKPWGGLRYLKPDLWNHRLPNSRHLWINWAYNISLQAASAPSGHTLAFSAWGILFPSSCMHRQGWVLVIFWGFFSWREILGKNPAINLMTEVLEITAKSSINPYKALQCFHSKLTQLGNAEPVCFSQNSLSHSVFLHQVLVAPVSPAPVLDVPHIFALLSRECPVIWSL